MKVAKIDDDVDLKELERFGFKRIEQLWFCQLSYYSDVGMVINEKRFIKFQGSLYDNLVLNWWNYKLYQLISVGFVKFIDV